MTNQAQVEATLLDYLTAYHPECGPIEADTDLIESGQLDSLVLVDLLQVLKAHYQLEVQPQDIAPKNFRTLRTMAELTIARLAATRRAA